MMTVNEVSRLTGVSIRALHYYDQIGLLPAAGHTDSGYRLYDDAALERLQQILLFRELEFSLKDIQRILSNSAFDREKALEQQIELPEQKGCTLLLCAEEKTLMKALELARQLREEGFAVAVMQKQDHKQEAEYLGAEFIAHLTEQEVLNGMILVSSQRSDRIDEVSISGRGLTDYIYERTMSQAMQDVEESLNADTSTYDFTKGFSLF